MKKKNPIKMPKQLKIRSPNNSKEYRSANNSIAKITKVHKIDSDSENHNETKEIDDLVNPLDEHIGLPIDFN